MAAGSVEGIYLTSRARGEATAVDRAQAVAGRGLEGDRYANGKGSFSHWSGNGRELTLIEREALDALAAATGVRLEPGASRRNVVTSGIDLNALVGETFQVGSVECVGRRLCDPCRHLERLTAPGVLRGLAGRGGLRADIVTGGEIAVGDAVVAEL